MRENPNQWHPEQGFELSHQEQDDPVDLETQGSGEVQLCIDRTRGMLGFTI